MQLAYVQEFRQLCSGGTINFSATAEKLNLTQPALSNHIQALENELGCCLIERGKGRASRLTPAGGALLERADELICLVADIEESCRRAAAHTRLVLRIQMPIYVDETTQLLVEAARSFKQEQGSALDVSYINGDDMSNPIERLAAGDIDCCLCSLVENDRSGYPAGLDLVPLPQSTEEVLAWVDVRGPLGTADPLGPNDFNGSTVPMSTCGISGAAESWIGAIRRRMNDRVTPRPRYAASVDTSLLSALDVGDVQFFPAHYARHPMVALREHRTMRHLDPPLHTTLNAVFRHDDANPAGTAFKEFLAQKAG